MEMKPRRGRSAVSLANSVRILDVVKRSYHWASYFFSVAKGQIQDIINRRRELGKTIRFNASLEISFHCVTPGPARPGNRFECTSQETCICSPKYCTTLYLIDTCALAEDIRSFERRKQVFLCFQSFNCQMGRCWGESKLELKESCRKSMQFVAGQYLVLPEKHPVLHQK